MIVLVLAALAALVQVLDLVTFLRAVRLWGVHAESNPVARLLYAQAGPAGIAAMKLAVAIVVPTALAVMARFGRHRTLARGALVLAIAIGAFGVLSNLGVQRLVVRG